jgi:hypothetical protein
MVEVLHKQTNVIDMRLGKHRFKKRKELTRQENKLTLSDKTTEA